MENRWCTDSSVRPGDAIIVSGYMGDHGIALLSFREGYGFESEVQSDVAPLNRMIAEGLKVGGIVAMKDPTRGGLANTLNEWCGKSHVGMEIDYSAIPLRDGVVNACDLLGIDPLSIGNEGKCVMGVVPEMADEVLKAIRRTPEGKDAAIIGHAVEGAPRPETLSPGSADNPGVRPKADPGTTPFQSSSYFRFLPLLFSTGYFSPSIPIFLTSSV